MMKYPILKISLTLAALLWLTGLYAQQPGEDGAFAGAKGIYVYLGPEMVSPEKPWNDIVAYRIYRSDENSGNWRLLKEVKAPNSLEVFTRNLENAIGNMPYPVNREDLPATIIWNEIQQADSMQQAWQWVNWLPVRLALGLYYFDASAKPDIPYNYKITYSGDQNNILHEFEYAPAHYPGKPGFGEIQFVNASFTEGGLELSWEMQNPEFLTWCELQRSEKIGGPFKSVNASLSFFPDDNGVIIYTLDPTADPDHFYAYRVVPVDYFGNRGNPSAETKTGAYDFFLAVNLPDSMTAISSDDPPGILISWYMELNPLVNAIHIFRSESYDGEYRVISTLNPGYNHFLDENAEPMKPYFYVLQLAGYDGQLSPRSARFTGIYRASAPVSPPQITRAYIREIYPALEILPADDQTAGFLIYRRNHAEMKWELISEVLPVQQPFTVFADQDVHLDPAAFYDYAVSAVNAGNGESEKSAYVTLRSGGDVMVPTVFGLETFRTGQHVLVNWNIPPSANVQGFLVYRRNSQGTPMSSPQEFSLLIAQMLPVPVNRFMDTTAITGISYDYAVETIDRFGNKSEKITVFFSASPDGSIPVPQLIITRKSGGFLLGWSPCFPDNIEKMVIFRTETANKPRIMAELSPETACDWFDENVNKGNTYSYSLIFESSGGIKSESNKVVVSY